MEYRTFTVTVKDDGNLEFLESQQQLNDDVHEAVMEFASQVDWKGNEWGGFVIGAGIESYPDRAADNRWAVMTSEIVAELEQAIRDEKLGELVEGQVLDRKTNLPVPGDPQA